MVDVKCPKCGKTFKVEYFKQVCKCPKCKYPVITKYCKAI
jgi:predicted Zn-ribbon and HTH transcriptional regulator